MAKAGAALGSLATKVSTSSRPLPWARAAKSAARLDHQISRMATPRRTQWRAGPRGRKSHCAGLPKIMPWSTPTHAYTFGVHRVELRATRSTSRRVLKSPRYSSLIAIHLEAAWTPHHAPALSPRRHGSQDHTPLCGGGSLTRVSTTPLALTLLSLVRAEPRRRVHLRPFRRTIRPPLWLHRLLLPRVQRRHHLGRRLGRGKHR